MALFEYFELRDPCSARDGTSMVARAFMESAAVSQSYKRFDHRRARHTRPAHAGYRDPRYANGHRPAQASSHFEPATNGPLLPARSPRWHPARRPVADDREGFHRHRDSGD